MDRKRKYKFDVKAEYVAADYVEKGQALENTVIAPQSQFTRGYRSDILENINGSAIGRPAVETINVSREGLYDYLPQSLFHENYSITRARDGDTALQKINKTQSEEKQARMFFFPVERELNLCRIILELQERNSLNGFSNGFINSSFLIFWRLTKNQIGSYSSILFLLPACHQIASSCGWIAAGMQAVLGVGVDITRTAPVATEDQSTDAPTLDNLILGKDFILQGPFHDGIPSLKIKIGPLAAKDIHLFLPNEQGCRILSLLCDFLLPLEMKKIICYVPDDEIRYFSLEAGDFAARLEFTTWI